jgi:hypothetical protein
MWLTEGWTPEELDEIEKDLAMEEKYADEIALEYDDAFTGAPQSVIDGFMEACNKIKQYRKILAANGRY